MSFKHRLAEYDPGMNCIKRQAECDILPSFRTRWPCPRLPKSRKQPGEHLQSWPEKNWKSSRWTMQNSGSGCWKPWESITACRFIGCGSLERTDERSIQPGSAALNQSVSSSALSGSNFSERTGLLKMSCEISMFVAGHSAYRYFIRASVLQRCETG